VTHPGLGQYRSAVAVTQLGKWDTVWTISGTATGVQTDSFFVREPAVQLCEIEDVEHALHLAEGTISADVTERAAVISAIIGVSARVIAACGGRRFIRGTYTEAFWVDGSDDEIVLTQRPVISITSVELDGSVQAVDVYQSQANVVRRLGWRPWGLYAQWSLVEVVYVGGFLVPPDDIVDLVANRVAGRVNNPQGLRQYSIGSFSATVSTEELEGSGWSASELATLRRYGAGRVGMLRVKH
jgi:hypothetical protein